MNKKNIISVVAVVLLVGGIFGLAKFKGSKTEAPVVAVAPTVATVNGVNITKDTYDTQLASAITAFKQQGVNTDDAAQLAQIKTQVLNDLISNELVAQAIKAAGIKAADADVNTQFQALITQVGGQDKFVEQLKAANMTEATLKENIAKQISIQTYLAQNIDLKTAVATDAEAKKFYDDNKKAATGDALKTFPAYKDVEAQIKQQLASQKQQVLVNAFVQSLRTKANVTATTTL